LGGVYDNNNDITRMIPVTTTTTGDYDN